jgi:dTDP-4-dehydrorhamnose 3,5-epimerase
MIYIHSQAYCKQAESGVRYDDPAIGINWIQPISQVSEKDKSVQLLTTKFKGIEI